jgi:hypothetical protein
MRFLDSLTARLVAVAGPVGQLCGAIATHHCWLRIYILSLSGFCLLSKIDKISIRYSVIL